MGLFSDGQKKMLVLGYLLYRDEIGPGVRVAEEDIERYMNSCIDTVVMGEAVRMVSEGKLYIKWDEVGGFRFRAREDYFIAENEAERVILDFLEKSENEGERGE